MLLHIKSATNKIPYLTVIYSATFPRALSRPSSVTGVDSFSTHKEQSRRNNKAKQVIYGVILEMYYHQTKKGQ